MARTEQLDVGDAQIARTGRLDVDGEARTEKKDLEHVILPQIPRPTDNHHDAKKAQDQNVLDDSTSTSTASVENGRLAEIRNNAFVSKCWAIISWTPQRCRWDPKNPPHFSMALNLLFGFAATFTVANLYYNHPILAVLAKEFGVSDERISIVPTVMQAGYAAGLIFLCPLGDIVWRRPFVLCLIFITATIWLGLCITSSFPTFVALSFLTSVTTVTPQLMLPLAGDLAPPHRRATALSIVVSGLMLGMLLARLLSGIMTTYTTWRSIYYLSFGLQYLILILLYFFLPDYPPTTSGISYPKILLSILQHFITTPVLVQACLIGFLTSSIFTSFWTTLTFHLTGAPYNFTPVPIALFALLILPAIFTGPLTSRYLIDIYPSHFAVLLGLILCLIGSCIGTYVARYTLAGPIIQALFIDIGLQATQIANRTAIYKAAPKARNRVNTAYMLSVFCGQLMGTAVGNRLFAQGGWEASGSASVGFVSAALVVCVLRGPRETRWIGWRGGWAVRRLEDERKSDITAVSEDLENNVAEGDILSTLATGNLEVQGENDESRERNSDGSGNIQKA